MNNTCRRDEPGSGPKSGPYKLTRRSTLSHGPDLHSSMYCFQNEVLMHENTDSSMFKCVLYSVKELWAVEAL
ncbi:hypothetical protein J1N35_009027 [Gossypium stocksii]|uniref:Uncharacterized protein n=1 Tax=Gossypium stocksii TaxID=47602 RepID=A0A9D4AGP6_9ROSI|nr:hypothetical protein J1N35_009027 [Gossypium stocksii]